MRLKLFTGSLILLTSIILALVLQTKLFNEVQKTQHIASIQLDKLLERNPTASSGEEWSDEDIPTVEFDKDLEKIFKED